MKIIRHAQPNLFQIWREWSPVGSKMTVMIGVAAGLILWGSPAMALVAGICFALVAGQPPAHWNHKITQWLLKTCVVLLGFGMDLPVVLRLGIDGAVFAAGTIGATLLLGWWLGRKLGLNPNTGTLISVGTAICGGAAIAAVSPVIAASETEIAISIGTIFTLNAVALYAFPLAGHWLHLSQSQFGLWSGVAIHDISSVVGAGLNYGPVALATATAVKLSRTLWIIPLTLALAARAGRRRPGQLETEVLNRNEKPGMTIPWFIILFLLASLMRSYVPGVGRCAPALAQVAHRGMVLVLFLVGTSISFRALRAVGWRTMAAGLALWFFIGALSLVAIRFFA